MSESDTTPSFPLGPLRDVIAHVGVPETDRPGTVPSNGSGQDSKEAKQESVKLAQAAAIQLLIPHARVSQADAQFDPASCDSPIQPKNRESISGSSSRPGTPPEPHEAELLQLSKTIFRDSRDAMAILRELVCVSHNQAASEMFQCTSEMLEQNCFLKMLTARFEMSPGWRDHLQERLTSVGIASFEIKRRSGQDQFWCELKIQKMNIAQCDYLLVSGCDMTAHKSREQELMRNCDFLMKTINAVSEPLAVKTSDLDIVLVNDSFCETHNVERESVIGKPSAEVVRNTNPTKTAFYERKVLDTGRKQATIDAFYDVADAPFILSTYYSSFNDQASGQPYVVASSRDVTTEVKRENRLRLLASVFEAAQEGVAILNPQGEICEANPEFIATIGKSHAKVLGACMSSVVNCDPNEFSEIIRMAQTGRPWFGNVKMINQRKEEIACWLSLSPSKNVKGETTNLIAMFSDITQIEATKKELRRQALHDNLTDLPNRRFYRGKIAELIESDKKGDIRFGVSFLDLDDFKIVNDTLGHDAGDQLLVEVSQRIHDALGSECFLARFGGDEFALMIPESEEEPLSANMSARKVVQALCRPFDLAGHEVHIGVSVGTTIYPDHARDVESLMRNADVAMYRAKEEGKNKARMFSIELVETVEKRQTMLNELRVALELKELNVVYQPKYCLKTNRINSCEALVRWTTSDGQSVSPSEFIPLAEDFGLIFELGNQVLEAACLQARAWHESGLLRGRIALNLSPRQFKEPNFMERLTTTLKETKVHPSWLEFEITENTVMDDKDRALKLMHEINELGITIAMDDFGTGYSSLSCIRDFPIQTLKIDMTFVKDLPSCSRAVAIAKTVLSLGHGLDLEVVAEGVETEEQLKFLREQGCDQVQGYLISRPIPAEEFERLL
ncbi:MAG: diguanylate cyclase (GGDEF)-like protein/PAS domain S-box-containing protein [Mariniblastus sp.]|jgi:diguanylate cyclase (GGDEF)-like protein/PAS domain S-box-containing protein